MGISRILFFSYEGMTKKRTDILFFRGYFFLHYCWFIKFQELTLTDDTVLEEHNEDPTLVQMRLLGDGGTYHLNNISSMLYKHNLMKIPPSLFV